MNSVITLIFILASLLISGCQVKEASSDGGLISGHKPATNSFTVQTPTSKTYVEAEVITFNVTYPFDIIADFTGGNPRLRITVGSTTRYATFDSHPEPRKLVFKYVVQAGDADTNGVDINALELNGSTLQFDKLGVVTNCDVTTVTTKNFPGAKIDTIAPTISGFNLTNLPGLYNAGEKITFSMTFSENVYVTGTPKFVMNLTTGGAVDVTYVTGSGSTILSFSYTIANTVSDTNGFDGITSPIDVGTGAIKDVVGNNANLDFSALVAAVITYSSNVQISGLYPYVINITIPVNGTYVANDNLDFILEFDRPVTVSGAPYMEIAIGSNTRQAQYLSGSGTELITFRYTAVPGDVDSDGISVTGSIVQNAGDIVDTAAPTVSYFANVLNNSFTVPSTTGVILNALQPQPISVARNVDSTAAVWGTALDNVWNIGQELLITVGFNTGIFVNQTNGTPSITMTIGATSREATYLSGGNGQTSLIFRYVIQEGDFDTDGTITLSSINLNNGVITDAENTNSLLTLPVAGLTTTSIDGVRPTISSSTPPPNATYSKFDPFNENEMDVILNWSEPVNYSDTTAAGTYIGVDVGGTNINFRYASGNNSASVIYNPADLTGRNDSNGIAVSSPVSGTATIRDQAGNTVSDKTFTPPDTTGVLVDTTAPTVTSISAITSDGSYKAGETLDFSVTFSESVTTNVSGGYPRIAVTIGSTTRYLTPVANTTNTTHTFRYTIVTNELDTNGITLANSVQSNGSGYARDAGRNNVTGTFTPPNTTGILVDAVAPTISSRSFSTARTYISGETLQISVTFSENVNVDTTGGTPYIAVDFDAGIDNYDYVSGSGTTTLVFSRTLDGNHFDMNGLPSAVSSITLNGGTLQDISGNDASTTFTAIDLSTTYVTYSQVKLWTKNDFINIAPPGGVSITSTGTITTESCGIGVCRTFDGDDSLSLSSALNSVEYVFLVFKAPASVGLLASYDIFATDVSLNEDLVNNSFDLTTANATLNTNGTITSGVNHDLNLALSSTNILQVKFTSSQNFNSNLIETAFTGAIGEVIATDGALTNAQRDNIRNYLDSRY